MKDWILANPHKSAAFVLGFIISILWGSIYYPNVAIAISFFILFTFIYGGIVMLIKELNE